MPSLEELRRRKQQEKLKTQLQKAFKTSGSSKQPKRTYEDFFKDHKGKTIRGHKAKKKRVFPTYPQQYDNARSKRFGLLGAMRAGNNLYRMLARQPLDPFPIISTPSPYYTNLLLYGVQPEYMVPH